MTAMGTDTDPNRKQKLEKKNQDLDKGNGRGRKLVSDSHLLQILLTLLVSGAFGHFFLPSSCFSKLLRAPTCQHFASCSYHITSYPLPSGFAFDAEV